MKLEKLYIRRLDYGEFKGNYSAEVSFDSEKGKIELNLTPELSNKLLEFCGDAILQCSESAAKELNESIKKSLKK